MRERKKKLQIEESKSFVSVIQDPEVKLEYSPLPQPSPLQDSIGHESSSPANQLDVSYLARTNFSLQSTQAQSISSLFSQTLFCSLSPITSVYYQPVGLE
jgi:hypothetical protein